VIHLPAVFSFFSLSGKPARRVAFALSALLLLAACSSAPEVDKTTNWSAEQLYADGKESISAGNWKDARERMTAIESRYPFGPYAQQALVDLAYINWKDGENDQALAAIDRFQQLYPNHPGTDYMLYLKGLIHFTPASAIMTRLSGQDPAERDPKGLRASYDAFSDLIKRYPDSRYTPDAKARMTWLVNALAMNEVYVARYYYDRGAYVAAINRAQTVITDFGGVPATEPALYIMVQSYDKLGMTELKNDTQRVFDKNYPDSSFKTDGLASLSKKAWWQLF
jgi:outer membrane protein assembly factor BamD